LVDLWTEQQHLASEIQFLPLYFTCQLLLTQSKYLSITTTVKNLQLVNSVFCVKQYYNYEQQMQEGMRLY